MSNKISYKYLPVFLVGMIDGIIVPLTVYAFFVRVLEQQGLALQITAIGGIALAIMLGAGAYLTRKTEIENAGDSRILKIYDRLDIGETIKAQMTKDTLQENEDWQKEWLDTGNATDSLSPAHYALIMGLAYFCGLIVILTNGLFINNNSLDFLFAPLLLLALLGFAKFKMAGQNPLIGTLMIVVSGAVAVLSNWLIAGLF